MKSSTNKPIIPETTNRFQPQGRFKIIEGSFTSPIHSGLRLLPVFCGLKGKYESESEKSIAKIWKSAETEYKRWYALQQGFKPGEIKETVVSSDTWVVNLLVINEAGEIEADHLNKAMVKLLKMAKYETGSVHLSEGLVSPEVKEALTTHLIANGINVYIYKASELLPKK